MKGSRTAHSFVNLKSNAAYTITLQSFVIMTDGREISGDEVIEEVRTLEAKRAEHVTGKNEC